MKDEIREIIRTVKKIRKLCTFNLLNVGEILSMRLFIQK